MIAIWIGAYVGIAMAVADAIWAGEATAPQRDRVPWVAIAWVALVWLPVMIVGLVLVAHDAIRARPRRIGARRARCSCTWEAGDSRCMRHPSCDSCGGGVAARRLYCEKCERMWAR